MLNLGSLQRDVGPQTRTLTILRGDGGPVWPEALVVAPIASDLDPDRPFNARATIRTVKPGEHYELDITVSPPWPNNRLWGEVRLATGVREQPTDSMRFYAGFPTRVEWQSEGTPIRRKRAEAVTVTLRPVWSDDRPPGKITSVESAVAGMSADLAKIDGEQSIVVRIAADCPALNRRRYHTILASTDDPSVPELRVPIWFE